VAGFWARAAAEPERTAVVGPDGGRLTAGELLARANQLAHGLRARGLRPGDALAAVLPTGVEALELYLAAVQSGLYLVPINFNWVGPEIAHVLADSEARLVIGHERFGTACAAAVEELGWPAERFFAVGEVSGFLTYESLFKAQPASTPVERTCGRLMNYTSGTTGRPKGVRRPLPGVTPEEFTGWGLPLPGYGLGDPGHVHLCCTPWYHTAPMVFIGPSLHMGHTLVLMDRFRPEPFLELIERHRVTNTLMVPTQFVRLLALDDEARRRWDLSSLRVAAHGAAPCPPDVKRRMIEWWGPVLVEYYASTEAGGTLVFADDWLRKPGTVGRALGETEIVILDELGARLPPGEIGAVCIRSGQGDFEYFKDPEKTAASHLAGYVTVGDIGYLDEDGYLFLCDRRSDVIISGGVNIYPAEVEGVLVTHPLVGDAAVFGIPSEEWGEDVKAVIEPVAGVDAEDREGLAEAVLAFCSGRLARYKIPRSIDVVAELPRDPNGKLYRRRLRDPYWAGRERSI
jgi:long-chain acyl-CoA synthetase